MWPRQHQTNQRHPQTAQLRLTFAADIKQPRMKGHRHRKPSKDKAGRIIKRIAPRIRRAQGPLDHDGQGLHRAFANGQQNHGRNQGRKRQADQRNQTDIGPSGKFFHVAPSTMPAIIRPRSRSLVVSGSRAPITLPSNITMMRSDKDMISSNSTETSNTALPASRRAMICL